MTEWLLSSLDLCSSLQVNAAAEVIYDLVDPGANLIFGAVIDQSLCGQVSLLSPHMFCNLFRQTVSFVKNLL